MPADTAELARTADAVREYVEARCFDDAGILMSSIDSHAGRPYPKDFSGPWSVPRRARHNPWAFWTYEDSVMCQGLYIDALLLEHSVTGDDALVARAGEIWTILKRIYLNSQIHGIGSFHRPYGGYIEMHTFLEPLGTDQASPLHSGLFRLRAHVDEGTRSDIDRCLLQTLEWYAAQNFEYFYYKFLIHSWNIDNRGSHHGNSYYLQAVAFAEMLTGDPKWTRILETRLPCFADGRQRIGSAFIWGSDLPVLADLLGAERFRTYFSDEVLGECLRQIEEKLEEYDEPGMLKRLCPESADPDFTPTFDPFFFEDDWKKNPMGFPGSCTRHHGRARPRHEPSTLLGLAAVGFETEKCLSLASEILTLRSDVPRDFTAWLNDDIDKIPPTVEKYARSVGPVMIEWMRDVRRLRAVEAHGPQSPSA